MKTYTPRPIDTSDVELPESLLPLMERLAENAHEVWAAERIKDGWKYGPTRDDQHKCHPCLIPYDKLPDSEKLYDHSTAAQTLKAVLSLGYAIVKSVD